MSRLAPLDMVRWGPLVVGSEKMADIEIVLTQSPTFDGYVTEMWVHFPINECFWFGIDNDADKWEAVAFTKQANLIRILKREAGAPEMVAVGDYDPSTRLLSRVDIVAAEVVHGQDVEVLPMRPFEGDPTPCPNFMRK